MPRGKVGWNSINVHLDVECAATWWSVKVKSFGATSWHKTSLVSNIFCNLFGVNIHTYSKSVTSGDWTHNGCTRAIQTEHIMLQYKRCVLTQTIKANAVCRDIYFRKDHGNRFQDLHSSFATSNIIHHRT